MAYIVYLAAVFKMAVLWRRSLQLDKSYFLVSLVQKSLVTKAAAAGNEKIDKKIRRKEERKEIVKEITKGYFADLREFRKDGGKRFFALGTPIEPKDSSPFPELKARNLAEKEVDLQKVFHGKVTLVLFWFRAFGEAMCDKYRLPFVENFHEEPLAQHYEINVVDGLFFKPFSRFLEKNLRKQRALERHDTFLCFSGNTKPIKEKFLENTIVGHALLVDCNGLVRWRAHANPTDEEIKFMLNCSKILLKDAQRALNNNKTISDHR